MANVVFGEETFSTNIRLENVSFETYSKIKAYINNIIGAAKAKQKAESKVQPAPAQTDKYAKVGHYNGWDKVVEIFKNADAHPESYTWERLSTPVWKSMMPTLKDVTIHGVAHTVGSMVREGITEKTKRYNPDLHIQENIYRLPVPVAKENIVMQCNPEDVRLGHILRKARLDAGLSVKELSAGIGYDIPIIMNWESGIYHMAETALKAIHNFFKKDIFAEAKEASA